MALMNLKAIMKQPTIKPSALEPEANVKPGLLKKKPFNANKPPQPMKGGLAAKLTGKY